MLMSLLVAATSFRIYRQYPIWLGIGIPCFFLAAVWLMLFFGLKKVKIPGLSRAPLLRPAGSQKAADWAVEYLAMSERSMFGWLAIVGVAHSGLLGWLVSHPQSHDRSEEHTSELQSR